ncbi:MAG: OmpH family outer membrane protein [Proteobacteria bacterium]|nr:OmpH family outer membrane protein [Pseudomonadota bacterium]
MLFRNVLVVLSLLAVPALAQAQDGRLPAAVVAVLDSQFVIANAQASHGIRTQVEAIRDVYSAEIAALEDQLRAEEQELQRQQAILAAEVFAQRRREFEDRVDYVQRLVEERNRQIDRAFNTAMSVVRDAVFVLIVEMAEQRGFNIILEKDDLVFAARNLDITNDVVAALNERLPNVNVPTPE